MDKDFIAGTIDHAILKPEATDADVERECRTAAKYKVASVCVKPSHVSLAASLLKGSGVVVSTVIGFPHGTTTTACKVAESQEALESGADELDMVLNIGKLCSGDFEYVKNDIRQVVEVARKKNALVKVILETALLGDELKVEACRLAEEAGAQYVKTSTGFAGGGATIHDIELMKKSVSPKMKIKASGGIKTFRQAAEFIEAGCTRLGTSATAYILEEDSSYDKEY